MKIIHVAGGQAEVDDEFAAELIASGQWSAVGAAEPKAPRKPRVAPKVAPAESAE